jgi:hypothetical protein
LSLSALTVGVPLVIATASLRRSLADVYRRWAGRVLETPIPSPYRAPDRPGVGRRVTTILRDPATWRDLLFLIVNSVVGVVLATLSVSLFLGGIMYLIYPFLWSVTPPNVFSTNFGVFRVHDLATSYYVMPLGVISLLLWWFWSPRLLRANARLARALLSPSPHHATETSGQRQPTVTTTSNADQALL